MIRNVFSKLTWEVVRRIDQRRYWWTNLHGKLKTVLKYGYRFVRWIRYPVPCWKARPAFSRGDLNPSTSPSFNFPLPQNNKIKIKLLLFIFSDINKQTRFQYRLLELLTSLPWWFYLRWLLYKPLLCHWDESFSNFIFSFFLNH